MGAIAGIAVSAIGGLLGGSRGGGGASAGGASGPSPVTGLGNIYNNEGTQSVQNEAQTANTVVDSYQQIAQEDSQSSGGGRSNSGAGVQTG
jgi:hypothetical protein